MNLLRPPAWTELAACIGMTGADFDPFHPAEDLPARVQAQQFALARVVCSSCPVRLPCAREALSQAIPDGMWGGLAPSERLRIARRHPEGFPRPGAARHGTRSAYVGGCTAGPDGRPCEPCLRAHRTYEQERRRIRAEQRRAEPPYLVQAIGRGPRAALPGQYLLLTLGLPPARVHLNPLTPRSVA